MLKIKNDDELAFEELYHCFHKPVGNFFFRLGCDRQTSEDYTQEVFLRIWKARKRYQPTAKFTTFLFQIAKNYWLNQRAQHKWRKRFFLYGGWDNERQQAPSSCVDNQLPQENLLAAELEQKIQAAIADLGEKYRLVFVLAQIEKMKYKDIAAVLNIPIGTVKSRMHIAEKKLRRKLQTSLK